MSNSAEKLKQVLMDFDKRLSMLEHSVNDVLISSLQKASDEYIDEDNFNRFTENYGKDIEPLTEGMHVLYGEDFDPCRTMYDSLKTVEGYGSEGFDEKSLVEAKIAELKDKLEKLKGKEDVSDDADSKDDEEETVPSVEQLAKEYIMYK